jgi:alkaline phosphatase
MILFIKPYIKVVLGGGRSKFLPLNVQDFANPNLNGTRLDGRNLIEDWKRHMERLEKNYKFICNASEFRRTNFKDYDHILGFYFFFY